MTETVMSLEDKIERRTAIRELVKDFNELGAEFEAVSEARKSITNRAKALGINKKAFQHAVQLAQMDSEKRAAYLSSLAELADALELNMQQGLMLGDPGDPGDDDEGTGNEDEQDDDDNRLTVIGNAVREADAA